MIVLFRTPYTLDSKVRGLRKYVNKEQKFEGSLVNEKHSQNLKALTRYEISSVFYGTGK